MKAEVQAFSLPKAGNALHEYEDAYGYRPLDATSREDSLRLAVADGATETSFCRHWAKLLSSAYCLRRLSPEKLEEGLPDLQRRWKKHVGKRSLPWYAEQKLESGAFAAIVGIEICDHERRWSAFAVGDCCVFQTRGEAILASFPLDRAELFDDRPLLLSSIAQNNESAMNNIRFTSGTWEPDDTFFLMSDAIAAWFLGIAGSPHFLNTLHYIKTQLMPEDFPSFIEDRRREKSDDGQPMMRNDDVTLLACTVT